MLAESVALYAAALSANSLAALIAYQNGFGRSAYRSGVPRLPRVVAWAALLLPSFLVLRTLPPFWYALRIGLYDFSDALLSAVTALLLLTLITALRGVGQADK